MTQKDEKTSEEIVFKPKYPARIMLTVYLYPIGVLICIFFIYMALASQKIFPYGIYALIFGFTTLSMPRILFREIRFGDVITVKRYYLQSQVYQYEDVIEFTPRMLLIHRGAIPLSNVENRSELEKIIKRLAARHKIKLKKPA
jgi:hypothetical protein